jgi:hypothetical protein
MHVRLMHALRAGDARRAVEDLTSILESVAEVFGAG